MTSHGDWLSSSTPSCVTLTCEHGLMLLHAATYDPQRELLPHLPAVHPICASACMLSACLHADLESMPLTCVQGFSGFASLPLPETVSVSEDPDFGPEVGARPSASLEPGMPLPCPALPCPALPCPALPCSLRCHVLCQCSLV